MKFWKYQGLGNDFIIVDNINGEIHMDASKAEALCNRRFGIGADGVMLVEPSSKADVRMIIYNSDGSRPAMCGNGIRCFTRFVYDQGIVRRSDIAVETDAGVMNIAVNTSQDQFETAVVNMGRPDFTPDNVPVAIDGPQVVDHEIQVDGSKYRITSMLMGVPHTVIFTDSLEDEAVMQIGSKLECASIFPQKTNVNFVKVIDKDNIIIRTWERGAGYTYACGTGACACVIAGVVNGLLNEKARVQLRGGDLTIHWKDRGDVFMEGPAKEVFEGNCPIF